jgi:ssDNA-specific exonuclease RecJ
MDTQEKQVCRKKSSREVSFDFKLSVIDEINNGLISVNYAAKKYNISRSTIEKNNRNGPNSLVHNCIIFLSAIM